MRSSRQTSSLPRRRRGRRQMLEAAEADLRSKPAFCLEVKGAPGIPGNLVAKFVDANKRRFGLRDGGVGPVARRQTHRSSTRSRGTEPPFDMLMTLQDVYEKSPGTLSPSPRRAPRWTRFGQWTSSIYRSLTERLPRQHSTC